MTDEKKPLDTDSARKPTRADDRETVEKPRVIPGEDAPLQEADHIETQEGRGPDSEPAQPSLRETPHAESDSSRKPTKKELGLLRQRDERIADLTQRSEALQTEVNDLKDKWLRSAAELENFRKRTRREWELLQQRTIAETVLDILDVVDDFERAFLAVGDRDDDFVRGIKLIYNNLVSALEKVGVQKIDALHAAFDPAYHMAVAQIDRDGAESNEVVEIVQEGYRLGDTVVRPAKVVIAK